MHDIAENESPATGFIRGTSNEIITENSLSVINQLKELTKSRFTDEDYLASIKTDILGDSIYLLRRKATS